MRIQNPISLTGASGGDGCARTVAWLRMLSGIALLLTIFVPALAPANPTYADDEGIEHVIFVRDNVVWQLAIQGADTPVALASLGDEAAAVTRLVASPRGDGVIVELGARVGWAASAGPSQQPLRMLDCQPPVHFQPQGALLSCVDKSRKLVVYQVSMLALEGTSASQKRRVLSISANSVLGWLDNQSLAIRGGDGLWAASIDKLDERRRVAPHQPSSWPLIGPNGKRMVGVYPGLRTQDTPGLYIFRLNDKAVRRRLMNDAEPRVWSLDGAWLAVQSRREGACMVRARGGQYKCWRRFEALAPAPTGDLLLLAKPVQERDGVARFDLYLGRRDGVKPERPKLLTSGVAAAAIWAMP